LKGSQRQKNYKSQFVTIIWRDHRITFDVSSAVLHAGYSETAQPNGIKKDFCLLPAREDRLKDDIMPFIISEE
jgi:hypothetical protein